MSGPIVRKYGFPNFESIFGERPIQHGVDADAPTAEPPTPKPAAKVAKKSATADSAAKKTPKKK